MSSKQDFQMKAINTFEHLAIKRLKNVYYKINLNGMNMNNLNIIPPKEINSLMQKLSSAIREQVNVWTDRLYEVFNRRASYQGISW